MEDGVPGCFSFLRRRPAAAAVPAPPQPAQHPHTHYTPPDALCIGSCDFPLPASEGGELDWNWNWSWNGHQPGSPGAAPPPKYSPGQGHAYAFDEAATATVEETIERISAELRVLSLKIHDHPELAFQEKYAHDVLTEFMESHGFEVTRHYLGLETAWLATVTVRSGGRTLGFNSEMDSLPGIGHACGHNLIAIGGVAAAIGVATALKKHNLPGTVSLIGTPAEEGGGGKIILLEKGAYDGFAACLMIHPGPGPARSTGVGSSLAIERIEAEFAGHTAHASAAPWEGRNALDAAFVSYSAISALRQQVKPTHRIHGVVQGKDWAANIIPDYAKMTYIIRAPTYTEVEALAPRLKACFEAGAHATATKVTFGAPTTMYDLFQNGALIAEYRRVCEGRYGMSVSTAQEGAIGGSTDFGNVSYAVPGLHPAFAIPTVQNGGNHTRLFADAAGTKEAHEATLFAAKGIALAGLRVLLDKEFADQVMQDFKAGKPQ
ncbi:amidohydrolase [Calocera cornea HHB12733]|uniref:Amidohydrolase n=1 Tax=Calocera cornea HHB12733 TaxID=1353952 RepID=A0A165EP28_9BASI|nr:amidohydrolase [Calocera cornea HHB12733]